MKKFTKENLEEVILHNMNVINNYNVTIDDLRKTDNWYKEYTTTKEKEKEFEDYLRVYLKNFISRIRLEKEIGHFILMYGLRTVDEKQQ